MRNRRTFSAEFKSQVVLQVLNGEKTTAQVCREHGLTAQTVGDWKSQFLAAAPKRSGKAQPAVRSRSGSPSWSRWSAS